MNSAAAVTPSDPLGMTIVSDQRVPPDSGITNLSSGLSFDSCAMSPDQPMQAAKFPCVRSSM